MSLEDVRKAMGTLPSDNNKINTSFYGESIRTEVNLIDTNKNPFRSIFSTATATWGDNNYEDKWNIVSLKNKLLVIVAALTGRTLPQALENVIFTWRIKGVPRSTFNYHTEIAKLGCTFYSIGCRDNNKLDTDFIIPYSIEGEIENINQQLHEFFKKSKSIYSKLLQEDQSSWQSARAFLPLCYQHSYHFSQNLLSLIRMFPKTKDTIASNLYIEIVNSLKKNGFELFYLAITDNKKLKNTAIENIELNKFEKELLEC